MFKVKLTAIVILAIISGILISEIRNKLYPTVVTNTVEKIVIVKSDDSTLASVENHKPKYDPYTDKSWSKRYSKSGDRNIRYSYNKEPHGLKYKWVSWKGGVSVDRATFSKVVRIVLDRLPHIKSDENVVNLVVETAISESLGGKFIKSSSGDYGILQIKPWIVEDMYKWLQYKHKDVYAVLQSMYNNKLSMEDNLIQNVPYAIAVCVTEYWRKAGPNFHKHISTMEERAVMWKSVYNTKKGVGTVNCYLSRNEKYKS